MTPGLYPPGPDGQHGAMKKCAGPCGATFPTYCFNSDGRGGLRPRCRVCEITLRTEAKYWDRFVAKAEWALDTKARWAKRRGLVTGRRQLIDRNGWDLVTMREDARTVWRRGCPVCFRRFKWLHELVLMTVDVDAPFDYGANTAWLCSSCAGMKRGFEPGEWRTWVEQSARYWAEHRAWKDNQLPFDPPLALVMGGGGPHPDSIRGGARPFPPCGSPRPRSTGPLVVTLSLRLTTLRREKRARAAQRARVLARRRRRQLW